MKKIMILMLSLMLTITIAACGSKSEEVKGDMVKAEIPSGWSFVSGTDMTGGDASDFIPHTEEKFKVGDAYLQVDYSTKDIDYFIDILKKEKVFGEYYGKEKINGHTWYIAENAAYAKIGKKIMQVRGYKCNFESDEVKDIIGSLEWVRK